MNLCHRNFQGHQARSFSNFLGEQRAKQPLQRKQRQQQKPPEIKTDASNNTHHNQQQLKLQQTKTAKTKNDRSNQYT